MIFTLLHRSSDIGTCLYSKCQEIWNSASILSGSNERDHLLVAYVASKLGSHARLLTEHMECFNIGIKALSKELKRQGVEIPDTFGGVRKLPVERQAQILKQITTTSKNPGTMTPMEQAWHYLLYTLPATAIMTDENLVTYIFDSTSAHHKRIIDCLPLFFEFTASGIESCVKSLPDDEVSLKPAICTLYNHLRAPKQGAILLNKEESINDGIAHLVLNQLERLSLHTAGEKTSLAAFSSQRGRPTSNSRLSTSRSHASSAVQPMSQSRSGTPLILSRSQSETFTDSSDQTGDESRNAFTGSSIRKKPRRVSRDNQSRASRARKQAVPISYGTRSHSTRAVSKHAQVS